MYVQTGGPHVRTDRRSPSTYIDIIIACIASMVPGPPYSGLIDS